MKTVKQLASILSPSGDAALKHVSKNTLWLFIAQLGTHIFLLLFNVLLARRIGEFGLGQYGFLVAAIFLGNVASTFGTDMILIRRIAATRDLSYISPVIGLQLALALPMILVFYLIPAEMLNISEELMQALQIYSLALIPMAFYSPFSAALRGVERMDAFMWLNLSTVALQVVLGLLLIQSTSSIHLLVYILLVTQSFSAILAGVLCIQTIPGFQHSWRISFYIMQIVFRISIPIAILGILGVLYQRVSVYLLTMLGNSAMTGWFVAGAKLAAAPKIAHHALMGALLPIMAHNDAKSKRNVANNRLFLWSLLGLIALSFIAAVVLIVFAAPLTYLLYGDSFEPTIAVIKLLALSLIPFTLSNYLSLRFFTTGNEAKMLIVLTCTIIILVIANIYSIPRWGATGGALAILLAEMVQAILYMILWLRLPASQSE